MSYIGVWILDLTGNEVAYTEIPVGLADTISGPVTPGRYIVRVHHYIGVLSPFTATARLA